MTPIVTIPSNEAFWPKAPIKAHHSVWLSRHLRDFHSQLCHTTTFNLVHELSGAVLQKKKDELNSIITSLDHLLHEREIPFVDIHGRIKGIYSTYRKMLKYNMDINRVYDLVGVRIFAGDKDMCYRTLEALHTAFSPVDGRFKDYIAKPKDNGYRSLHTSVRGMDKRVFEVQIRTPKMHNAAEYGSAAHRIYKIFRDNQLKKKTSGSIRAAL